MRAAPLPVAVVQNAKKHVRQMPQPQATMKPPRSAIQQENKLVPLAKHAMQQEHVQMLPQTPTPMMTVTQPVLAPVKTKQVTATEQVFVKQPTVQREPPVMQALAPVTCIVTVPWLGALARETTVTMTEVVLMSVKLNATVLEFVIMLQAAVLLTTALTHCILMEGLILGILILIFSER